MKAIKMNKPKIINVRIPECDYLALIKKCGESGYTASMVLREAVRAYIQSEELTPKFFMLDTINVKPIRPVGRPKQQDKPTLKRKVRTLPLYMHGTDVIMHDKSEQPRFEEEFTSIDKAYIAAMANKYGFEPKLVKWIDDKGKIWEKQGLMFDVTDKQWWNQVDYGDDSPDDELYFKYYGKME